MKVIKAPQVYEKTQNEIACFMAGGCGNIEWQERFIKTLEKYILNHLVLYNPYNPDDGSPNYVENQVKWEFDYLNKYIEDLFIFSMYFDKHSVQAMSMYELGRMLSIAKEEIIKVYTPKEVSVPVRFGFPCVISVHEDAPNKDSIIIQTKLAGFTAKVRTPEEHALEVARVYKDIKHHLI